MGLESATYISGLNANNPVNLTDIVGEGDDHIRLVKSTLLNTFPNITGEMSRTHTELNNAAIKNVENIFTDDQRIQSTRPTLILDESDAAANEQVWHLRGSGGSLFLQAVDDAETGIVNVMQVARTATVIDNIDVFGDFRVRGKQLQVWDSGLNDSISFDHDGTDSSVRFPDGATTDWNIDVAQQLSGQIKVFTDTHFVSGSAVQIRDAANTDTVTFSHDGTDFNVATVSTGAINWRDGDNHRFWDAADSDYLSFSHDGAQANIVTGGVGGGDIRFQPAGSYLRLLAGKTLRVQDSTNADEIELLHDGTNGQLQSNTSIRVQFDTGELSAQFTINGNVSLYYNNVAGFRTSQGDSTGVTAWSQVKDHNNDWQDIGFNLLPEFNTNVSDTLEARHCGTIQRKNNSTARTLTLAASTDLDFPIHGVTHVVNGFTSGNYTITEGASTTLYYQDGTGRVDTAGGCTIGPGGVATIWRESAVTYYIWGTGITP